MAALSRSGVPWERLLSRWSLLYGLAFLAEFVGFAFAVVSPLPRAGLPEQFDLTANFAVQAPVAFRLLALLRATTWFVIAGFLLFLAGIAASRAPFRASIIALCGMAQLLGVIGAFAEGAIPDLASSYLASSAERAALLRSYLDLETLVLTPINGAAFLRAVGFLIVVWVALALPRMPPWLTALFGLAGLLGIAQVIFLVITGESPFREASTTPSPLSVVVWLRVSLEMVLAFGVAAVFWRQPAVEATRAAPVVRGQ